MRIRVPGYQTAEAAALLGDNVAVPMRSITKGGCNPERCCEIPVVRAVPHLVVSGSFFKNNREKLDPRPKKSTLGGENPEKWAFLSNLSVQLLGRNREFLERYQGNRAPISGIRLAASGCDAGACIMLQGRLRAHLLQGAQRTTASSRGLHRLRPSQLP